MRTEVIAGMVCVACSVIAIRYIDRTQPQAPTSAATIATASAVPSNNTKKTTAYQAGWNYEVRIPAGYDRQFRVTAAVNHQATNFLVDTGASFVALRESDARRAGIHPHTEDYTSPVSTANGITRAARVMVDEIEINSLRVRNVETFILPDNQLAVNLLGMSFLSELESVEARGNEMILRG